MHLNTLAPAIGSKTSRRRLGRGIGSGLGKTGGRGHKGQKARAGGTVKPGFEGGQMPLHRRLPKFGFKSRKSYLQQEVATSTLNKLNADVIDISVLKSEHILRKSTKYVKVMLSGEVSRSFTLKGISASEGAVAAIVAAGGKVEE
jgi:large subunit ribosomal protein L15